MSLYLLDTTVLIDFAKQREAVMTRVLALLRAENDLSTSPISVAEYYAGAMLGEDPTMDRFIRQLPCWETSREIAMIAGDYRYRFQREFSRKLPTADTLIAATARHYQATLLTNNPSDFPMNDITVERLGD